jgi:sulfoxide reductase heme-binding subunit YedZ
LHRLAYVAGALGAAHYILRVKADRTEPAIYASVLALLLGTRAMAAAMARRRSARTSE